MVAARKLKCGATCASANVRELRPIEDERLDVLRKHEVSVFENVHNCRPAIVKVCHPTPRKETRVWSEAEIRAPEKPRKRSSIDPSSMIAVPMRGLIDVAKGDFVTTIR